MKKNTSKKTGTPPAKAGAPVNEADLKAAIQAALKAVDGNYKITFGYDDIFNQPIVYTYCDFPTYQRIYSEIMLSKTPPEDSARGFCTIGRLSFDVDGVREHSVIMVWANAAISFDLTLPTFVHEIVHVAQFVFERANADDTNGEAMACLVEREVKRVLKEFFHMPTPDDMKTEMMAKIQAFLEKPSSKETGTPSGKSDTPNMKRETAAQTADGAGDKTRKFMTGYDETFLIPLVYTYSDFASFRDLCMNVLDDDNPPVEPSRGYYTFERIAGINDRCDARVGLVWVNNCTPLEETLPVFIHGIFLVVYDFLKYSCVNDRNGEVMAYTVEKETKRVLSEFFHLPVPENPKTKLLEGLGHSLAHKDDAPAPGGQKPSPDCVRKTRDQPCVAASGNSAESSLI